MSEFESGKLGTQNLNGVGVNDSNKSTLPVSVVLPVHNGEKYIAESVESVLSQTFKEFELIVVNDASNDQTLSILERYANSDPRLKIHTVEKQHALADVLNVGVKAAEGKYIARIDSDDVMMPDRLEKQVKFMEEHPDVVVVGGQVLVTDEVGNKIGIWKYSLSNEELKKKMIIFSPFAHPATLIRSDALARVGLYREGTEGRLEDIDLWFRLVNEGDFSNLDSIVIKYRERTDSLSRMNIKKEFNMTEVVRARYLNSGYSTTAFYRALYLCEKLLFKFGAVLPLNFILRLFRVGRKLFA